VLIEATVMRATLNEGNQFGIDFTILGGVDFQNVNSTSNAGADLQTGALPPNQFQDTTVNANTSFTGTSRAAVHVGIINNSVAVFVRALEEVTDVVVVGNPKVIALNKQEAEVIVGRARRLPDDHGDRDGGGSDGRISRDRHTDPLSAHYQR